MIRFKHAPEKDVGIEQELHARRAPITQSRKQDR
jgi:hypothetical protein